MKAKNLPEGWKKVELWNQEYFTILSSGIDKFKGEKEYLSTESVKGTKIEKIESIITYKDRPSRANMQPVLNSVWFAKMQATLKVYSFDEENKDEIGRYVLSTGFAGIKVNETLVSPKYLRLILTSQDFNELKDKLCTGSTQRGINNQSIETISLVIPPLSTQQRIVSILEKAEQTKEMRKEADELTKDLLKAVFMEMFGNVAKNNKKWQTMQAEELFDMKLGKMLSAANYTGKYLKPYLRNINVQWNYLDLSDVKKMDFNSEDFKRYELKKGDILVCEGGEVGRTAIYNGEIPNCCYQNALHRLRIKNQSVNPFYFIYYMIFAAEYGLLKQSTIQVTIAHFTAEKFKRLKIMCPPLPLQDKFASIVKEVESMKEQQKHSKEHIDNMFDALMQKAFKGEIHA